MPARIDDLLVLNANLNKSDFAKYLRDREAVLPNDFGGLGDGVADDRTAIQAAFDRAGADQKFAMIPPGTWNVSGTVTLPGGARGLIMQGTIRYTGTAPTSVLVLGDGGTIRNAEKLYSGLTDVTPTDRAVTLAANRGLGWMLDTSQAKEFALAHWLTSGASGGRLFVRVFDGAGNVREDIAGDVLASITTMQWNGPAKGWNAGAPMDDANFNRRQTIRVGAAVAYAQVGVIGFDGLIDLQSLRLYGLPEAAPAVLNGTPLLTGALFGSGRREFAAEVSWDLPSLAPGATSLLDVTVNGARAGDLAQASLVSSTRFIELDAAVWSNNTVRVMARNISAATFDLAAVTLSVGVVKRRVP